MKHQLINTLDKLDPKPQVYKSKNPASQRQDQLPKNIPNVFRFASHIFYLKRAGSIYKKNSPTFEEEEKIAHGEYMGSGWCGDICGNPTYHLSAAIILLGSNFLFDFVFPFPAKIGIIWVYRS